MRKQRKLYIIPGLGETTRSKNYKEVIRSAKNEGLLVVPVNILWSADKDMSDFIQQSDSQIPNNITNDYIFGFSFGAYIASILAKKKKAKGYIFCSISPYFKDDLKYVPEESRKYFGKKIMNSFKKYEFPKGLTSSAWFLIGEKDWKLAIKRAHTSFSKWGSKKEIYIIKGAAHELTSPNYIKKISFIIRRLQNFS
ncbi:MAG: hypothetical protein A3G99_01275 [Candidatus Zambryskibacteria bacterium RIFCSPLOWO2_12_FULL_39_23]|uniref:Alpha/beta hydrolase n=1 Tax=Candidatus Zambryskibacteria bacterium RIFCSPLOWO2_12_FULL_39_23 TaxID=1802776 RepID=A0A1G2US40_9BACT|nr:MAG: hypothetical protein A2W51_02060 [Candidatus Zambryskibacteria bacterium RIFCSPHIGHO2_02_39_10]OHB00014.1 MAG: hypothetical protein A3E59_00205 [Candidatus Zambryskibacteria bacterium RIFCSPHIGHO2_12_FULL_39_47]OHB12112.1 MAG: hypothetical protein A3G99_01275 [Candidatus Zambryskibacteria bacterium RIFCSPLOWO2_12_FULL_39_23]